MLGCRDVGDVGMQGCRDAGLQGCRDAINHHTAASPCCQLLHVWG